MAKRHLMLSWVLLQGLSMVAMDSSGSRSSLKSSADALRRSTSALSKSQELKKAAAKAVAGMYIDSPCGTWVQNRRSAPRCLKPIPPYQDGDWFP